MEELAQGVAAMPAIVDSPPSPEVVDTPPTQLDKDDDVITQSVYSIAMPSVTVLLVLLSLKNVALYRT